MKVSKGMVSTPYPSIVYFVPLELNIKFTSSNLNTTVYQLITNIRKR